MRNLKKASTFLGGVAREDKLKMESRFPVIASSTRYPKTLELFFVSIELERQKETKKVRLVGKIATWADQVFWTKKKQVTFLVVCVLHCLLPYFLRRLLSVE